MGPKPLNQQAKEGMYKDRGRSNGSLLIIAKSRIRMLVIRLCAKWKLSQKVVIVCLRRVHTPHAHAHTHTHAHILCGVIFIHNCCCISCILLFTHTHTHTRSSSNGTFFFHNYGMESEFVGSRPKMCFITYQ